VLSMYFLCIIYVLSVKGNKRGTEGKLDGNRTRTGDSGFNS